MIPPLVDADYHNEPGKVREHLAKQLGVSARYVGDALSTACARL